MKKMAILVLSLILMTFAASAANLTASVNRSPVPLGEVFVLTLKANSNITARPDLSVLEPHFKVYSTTASHQNYIINGKLEATTEWQIGLIALSSNVQEIPSISIGSEKTPPLKISVANGGEEDANIASKDALAAYGLKTAIFNPQAQYYVQQQIVYRVILTDGGGLQGGEPVFDDASGDWLIKSLGQPEVVNKIVDGQQVREIAFSYALFPQKSGALMLPAVAFEGYTSQAPQASPGINLFGGGFGIDFNMPSIFGMQMPVSLRAPAQNINILSVPTSYPAKWWLPSENVVLSARWLETSPTFKVGEAINREIVLRAVGVSDSQLPELNFISTNEFKQYPEKSTRENVLSQGKLVAVQKTLNVYVPEQSGRVIVPEISVVWFNTQTQKAEKATVPAMEIDVAPNPNLAPIKPEITVDTSLETSPLASDEQVQKKEIVQDFNKPSQWMYLLVFVAFVLGALFSYIIFRCRSFGMIKPQCEMRRYPDFIVQKAYQNDFKSLRDALVSWATGFYPERQIGNLADVSNAVDDVRFGEQIEIIITKLYGKNSEIVWNPKVFTDIFKSVIKKTGKKKINPRPLPPLYE